MNKRFLLEGETEEKVWLAVEFQAMDLSIDLYVLTQRKGTKEKLDAWKKGEGKLPKTIETHKRTMADPNLLPEEIKAKNVGKVRDIELEWGNTLIQSKLLESFDNEIAHLKDKIMLLEDYSKQVFDECSDFWKRVLDFKKENQTVSNDKIDAYKLDLDLLFDALKSLRKEHKKEFDANSIEIHKGLMLQLEQVEKDLLDNPNFKNLFNRLKDIRTEYTKTAMRQLHKKEVDTKINTLFDKVKEGRSKINEGKIGKRVTDLEGIIEKMTKSLNWDKRELGKLEKDKEYAQQSFQLKLIDTKIAMVQGKISEKEAKLKNIQATYDSLVKK
ncbi:MAG: hypothetical protein ACPG4Z_05275 [Chitinophagales bacterium]